MVPRRRRAIRGEIERLDDVERERLYRPTLIPVRLAVVSGDLARAQRLLDELLRWLTEHGQPAYAAVADAETGTLIDLLAGDAAAAERRVRAGIDVFADVGETGWRCTLLCYRADALILLGDLDEAERCVVEARAIGSTSDVAFEIGWRRALARVNSLRGEHGEAEPFGREALAVALETEAMLEQAETYACLAEVLARAGMTDEAREGREPWARPLRAERGPAYAAYINRRLDALVGEPA